MKKYHLTKKAFEDLSDIWTYTYDNWSEEQADKYYSILISTIEDIVQIGFILVGHILKLVKIFGGIQSNDILSFTERMMMIF